MPRLSDQHEMMRPAAPRLRVDRHHLYARLVRKLQGRPTRSDRRRKPQRNDVHMPPSLRQTRRAYQRAVDKAMAKRETEAHMTSRAVDRFHEGMRAKDNARTRRYVLGEL